MVILLVISAFLLSTSNFISGVNANYNITSDQEAPTGTTYYMNTSGKIEEISQKLNTEIEGSSGQDNLLLTAWKIIKQVGSSVKIMRNLITDLIKIFPVNDDFGTAIGGIFGTIVLIIIIFGIIGVVTRTRSP
ncbi:MAG: hypothetical protein ACTSWZ_05215 [Candidatus Heimdallarchaeaceae archaeon]